MRSSADGELKCRVARASSQQYLPRWPFPIQLPRRQPCRNLTTNFSRRVEPVFLTKRPDHARCYACHVESNNAFRLERLSPGARDWTEQQSRRNFEMVSILV